MIFILLMYSFQAEDLSWNPSLWRKDTVINKIIPQRQQKADLVLN
uniref:Uncharacterized protein n=1 Tax=Rhizophora mucronata TaxID=61149 RepID=A0A2P2NJC1_RHIMU